MPDTHDEWDAELFARTIVRAQRPRYIVTERDPQGRPTKMVVAVERKACDRDDEAVR